MTRPAAARLSGGPVNSTCALCGEATVGALCSACVRPPSATSSSVLTSLTVAVTLTVAAVALPLAARAPRRGRPERSTLSLADWRAIAPTLVRVEEPAPVSRYPAEGRPRPAGGLTAQCEGCRNPCRPNSNPASPDLCGDCATGGAR